MKTNKTNEELEKLCEEMEIKVRQAKEILLEVAILLRKYAKEDLK